MKKEMVLPVSAMNGKRVSVPRAAWSATSNPVRPLGLPRPAKCSFLHSAWLSHLSSFFSRLLEMRVTPVQTLHLLHAQLTFFLLAFPLPMLLWLRFAFLVWFALALLGCKRAGLKG